MSEFSGFDHEKLLDLTPYQLRRYYLLAVKSFNQKAQSSAMAVRVGNNAKEQDFKKYLKDLEVNLVEPEEKSTEEGVFF